MTHQGIPGDPSLAAPGLTRHDAAVADAGNRRRQAANLLRQWAEEDPEYDERIWPLVKEELDGLRTRCRE